MVSDDPFEQFEKRLSSAQKPVEPPTEDELAAKTKADFKEVFAALDRLDGLVKARYDQRASVSITLDRFDRQYRLCEGRIRASKPGTTVRTPAPLSIGFSVQNGTMWVTDNRFNNAAQMVTNSGARFPAAIQNKMVSVLLEILGDYFERP